MINPRAGYYLGDHRILTVTDRGDRMYLDTQDIMLTPGVLCWGGWEPETTQVFDRLLKPGMRWVDVGANIGYFTVIGHRLVQPEGGETFAFEANPRTFRFLNDNVRLNWFFDKVTVEQKAVYSSNTRLTLSAPDKYNVNASIGTFTPGSWEKVLDTVTAFDVEAVSLDAYFGDRSVDFLKVDVEGAEIFVLQGARSLIARNPAIKLLIEWSPGQMLHCGTTPAALADLVESLGLSFWRSDANEDRLLQRADLLAITDTTMILLQRPIK